MNMKRQSKGVRVIRCIKDHLNSLIKRKPSYQTRMRCGIFVFFVTGALTLVGAVHALLMILENGYLNNFGLWLMSLELIFSSGLMYLFVGVTGHSASPRDRLIGKTEAYMLVHVTYIMCMLASLLQFAPIPDENKLVPGNRVPTMPYVCLWLLFLVELTALLLYVHDVFRGLERWRPSRWWIRTTPYPVIGMIFLLFVNLWNDDHGRGADFSLVFSVAVSMLAVNYLVQIINERIVPREGPYKETHMAVYNRSIRNRPVYHRRFPKRAHVRRPKPSSPSAGRGEGAC